MCQCCQCTRKYDVRACMRMDPSPSVCPSMYVYSIITFMQQPYLTYSLHGHLDALGRTCAYLKIFDMCDNDSLAQCAARIQLVQPVHVAALIAQWRFSEILARQLRWPRQGSSCWDRRPDVFTCDIHVTYVHVFTYVFKIVQGVFSWKVFIYFKQWRKAYYRIGWF